MLITRFHSFLKLVHVLKTKHTNYIIFYKNYYSTEIAQRVRFFTFLNIISITYVFFTNNVYNITQPFTMSARTENKALKSRNILY